MKRVLLLGGTAWLGKRIAAAARDLGAEVTCLARGASGTVPAGVGLVRADRRNPDAYDALSGDWDEVIELAYQPELVAPALATLAGRAAHWTLVSSVSVYADSTVPHADESAALVTPHDLTQYADAKVAAEQASLVALEDRLLIVRPGLIVGAGGPSDRFGYWPARMHAGGRVLTPSVSGRHVQVIDVDDLASWIVRAAAARVTGVINAVGGVYEMQEFFDLAAAVSEFSGELVSLSDEALLAQRVNYWSGPRSLPLWLPSTSAGFMRRDGSAFLKHGGSLTSLEHTLHKTLVDEIERGVLRSRRAGLTTAEQSEILTATEHLR